MKNSVLSWKCHEKNDQINKGRGAMISMLNI